MGKTILPVILCVLMGGCATYNDPIANSVAAGKIEKANILLNELKNDKNFALAAGQLANDYFNGQLNGESILTAQPKYGQGVQSFYGVEEYRVEDVGIYKKFVGYVFGGYQVDVAAYVRAKTSNQLGATIWKDYAVLLDYFPDLRAKNDKYFGLRIKGVEEATLTA